MPRLTDGMANSGEPSRWTYGVGGVLAAARLESAIRDSNMDTRCTVRVCGHGILRAAVAITLCYARIRRIAGVYMYGRVP